MAGLPAGVNCAVFDFWTNQLIGFAKDSYTTGPLEPLSSSLLRFTPLNETGSDSPILIGSNLHLSMGATEIDAIRTTASDVTLKLSDAGARDGALTFFSRRPLALKSAEGCSVSSVKDLGDNIWQVNVTGRKWNTAQSIELSIN